jgi:hypothetical protein
MPWIASQIPNARLSVIGTAEGGSHFMYLKNPEAFNAEARNFLRENLMKPGESEEARMSCSQAVGTFLTTNKLGNATSRSLLVLTNDGHALRFDSDETIAATDRRAFGDSAGTWRCDGVEYDGTVRITAVMLDFTYPGSNGEKGQIVRVDLSGRYDPTTSILELEGNLDFLPMHTDAEKAAASSTEASHSIAIFLRGMKIKFPVPPR